MNYIIDRFEGDFAVLEDENRQMRNIAKSLLPQGANAGDCLTEQDGVFILDKEETARRQERIRKKMDMLWK